MCPQFDSVLRHHICGNSSVVEHLLAKEGVASSNLVFRSILRRHSQAVRQRSAKPLSPVRFWVSPPFLFSFLVVCRGGGTGRRKGLKIPRVVIPVPVRFRSAAPIKKQASPSNRVGIFCIRYNKEILVKMF